MGENYIRGVLNKYKSLIERLQSIDIVDPLDYLKQVVENLMRADDDLYRFDDSSQMYLFMKKFIQIKKFFEEKKHEELKKIKSYLSFIRIPITLTELATKKRIVDAHLELIDLNEVIFNGYQTILNDFQDFKVDFTNNFVSKHRDINQHYTNFGENLLISSDFKLLSEFCSIDQISQSLLNSPNHILQEIRTMRANKCSIGVRELHESLENNPICSRCNRKLRELCDQEVFTLLATQNQLIKDKINQSLLSTLQIIRNHEDGINEILNHEGYIDLEDLSDFFNVIFEFFNDEDVNEITSTFADSLYELFSEDVIEVIKKAFEKEPELIVIDLIDDIVTCIEIGMYTEEELLSHFQGTIESIKEIKKQEKYDELGLGPDDDKPVIHFSFSKR